MADEPARSTRREGPTMRGSLIARGANHFGMSRGEFTAATGLFMVMIVFKIVNMICWKFNSDEPDEMHMIWAWVHGFVPYREVFDNHMPLFQIMFAPLFAAIGDRATILYWMRFILAPMYFLAVWCTYRIGALLFSKRAGAWAVILAGLYPGYHFCSMEFRADNVWAPIWLLCMIVLLRGTLTVRRALAAGLLLGLCFGISMKTTLLLLSIFAAAATMLFLFGPGKLGCSWRHRAWCVAAFLASAAIVPVTIMIAFARRGLWPEFEYSVFEYNILPGVRNHPGWWIAIFPLAIPLVLYGARLIVSGTPNLTAAFRRSFVFLVCAFYLLALLSFWPLVSRQDFLPYHPLAFVLWSGGLLAISSHFLRRMLLPAFVAAIEFVIALTFHPFWTDSAKIETGLVSAVLNLTDPGDFVFDRKGETIFRQRCFHPALDTFALARIKRGLMADDVAKCCLETHTCVATLPLGLPVRTIRFIKANYLPVGDGLRVAGARLYQSAKDRQRFEFEIAIPAPYKIIAASGSKETGLLDGVAYDGSARFLAPGEHDFVPATDGHQLAALWSKAVDRGFTPFSVWGPR